MMIMRDGKMRRIRRIVIAAVYPSSKPSNRARMGYLVLGARSEISQSFYLCYLRFLYVNAL